MYRQFLQIAAAVLLMLLPIGANQLLSQADDSPKTDSKVRDAQKKLLMEVAARLVAVCPAVEGMEWPPDIDLDDRPMINAYATFQKRNGKNFPIVRIHGEMMAKVIQGDADRLAYVLGHEIGHILKKHPGSNQDKTTFLKATFTRDQEVEADLLGAELLVKAGFSFQKGIKAISRMKELGLNYASFEGLGTDHPSWDDRLVKMDKEKANLWKVSSAFTNGVYFLTTEQYEPAESCFLFVTKEFPGCYEAWANLGFARLMRYCDKLDKEDLEKLNIGQIITGGFYRRADSIPVRGMDTKLWELAKDALRESNRLKQNQTIVLANLGVCYLVCPYGSDIGEARTYLAEAAQAAKDDKGLDPVAHAALLINLGVATAAGASTEKGIAMIDATEDAINKIGQKPSGKRSIATCDAALLYTRALLYAASKEKAHREKARTMLEQYLKLAPDYSLYWEAALARYTSLCKLLGVEAKPKESFTKARIVNARLVTGVQLSNGKKITLGEDREDVEDKLGKGKAVRVLASQNLWKIRYEAEGVEILAGDTVLAITMIRPDAPAIPLQQHGPGATEIGQVKVGMSADEVEKLLGEDYHRCEIAAADIYYNYYRDQGIAVRMKKGKVTEVVIVQMPRSGGSVGQ